MKNYIKIIVYIIHSLRTKMSHIILISDEEYIMEGGFIIEYGNRKEILVTLWTYPDEDEPPEKIKELCIVDAPTPEKPDDFCIAEVERELTPEEQDQPQEFRVMYNSLDDLYEK